MNLEVEIQLNSWPELIIGAKVNLDQGDVHVDSFFVLEDFLEKVLEKIL